MRYLAIYRKGVCNCVSVSVHVCGGVGGLVG